MKFMAETEQTKVCPLCAETIKAAAKVCPHCRRPQNRWFFINEYDLMAVLSVILFAGAVFVAFKIFGEGRDFATSRDKITVLSSQFLIEANHDYTNVVVSGILTNASEYAWNLGEFEVRFLDAAGKVIDADESSSGSTVLSHSERSFRLTLYARTTVPNHVSYKVLVKSASDPVFWPSSD